MQRLFDEDESCYYFPISKVDGVRVNCQVYKSEEALIFQVISVSIGCVKVLYSFSMPYMPLNGELTIKNFVKEVFKILPKLRFENYLTKLYIPDDSYVLSKKRRRLWEAFQCDTITMDHGKCVCLCDSLTLRKVKCGHHLCLPCNQKIKVVNSKILCPICRADISENEDEEYD